MLSKRETVIASTIIFIIIVALFTWDIIRWKTFLNETNSDFSYIKWIFIIDN